MDFSDALDLAELLEHQDGVVSRVQLGKRDVSKAALDTMLRRRELVRVHPGVYLNHTGPITWEQRCWAAVLYAGHAALHLESALPSPDRGGPIHVAIDASRRVRPQRHVRIHRVHDLEDKVRWNTSPPTVRIEEAALEKAHRAASDLDAIAALTGVVGARRTTGAKLGVALARRSRMRRRGLVAGLLEDLDNGTHSVLEHGYLMRVLRSHGLPEPSQQQAPREGVTGKEYRDVDHADLDAVVELDSRWHDNAEASDRDADRDLDDLAAGQVTVRLRYRQVYGTPCRTAARMAAIFSARGWTGRPRACSPGCALAERTAA